MDISNAQVFIQKTSGWFQFYLQGGAYNIPVVGVPFVKTGPTTTACCTARSPWDMRSW